MKYYAQLTTKKTYKKQHIQILVKSIFIDFTLYGKLSIKIVQENNYSRNCSIQTTRMRSRIDPYIYVCYTSRNTQI